MAENDLLSCDIKALIEASYFSGQVLPDYPFKIESWRGILLQQEDLFEREGYLKLCEACDLATKDKSVYFCLTTFNDIPESVAPKQWHEKLDWATFDASTNPAWELAMSGHYWLGSSLKWGAIYSDEDVIIFGGDNRFMDVFEMLHGGIDYLRARFDDYMKGISTSEKKAFLYKLSQSIQKHGQAAAKKPHSTQ
jgi:hypothetical protein